MLAGQGAEHCGGQHWVGQHSVLAAEHGMVQVPAGWCAQRTQHEQRAQQARCVALPCFRASPGPRPLQVLDAMPTISGWHRPKALSPLLALHPSDLSLLVAMPALRLLCVPLGDLWLEESTPQRPQLEASQWALAIAFGALLPGLVVLSERSAQSSHLFCDGDPARGLDPAHLREMQSGMQEYWQAECAAFQQAALGLLRWAADTGQLSARAADLLAAHPADAQEAAAQAADAQLEAV